MKAPLWKESIGSKGPTNLESEKKATNETIHKATYTSQRSTDNHITKGLKGIQ